MCRLPYAMLLGGPAGCLGCMLLAGAMAGFTGYALAECMYDETGKRVRTRYPEVYLPIMSIVTNGITNLK